MIVMTTRVQNIAIGHTTATSQFWTSPKCVLKVQPQKIVCLEPLFAKILTPNEKPVSYSDKKDIISKNTPIKPIFSKFITVDPGSERFNRGSEGDVERNCCLSVSNVVENVERATGRNVITIDYLFIYLFNFI